jgi:hypothetical protein
MDPKTPDLAISLKKGSRVKARWFQANDPPSSLAGMQMKLGVQERQVEGIVTHVYGSHPTEPTPESLEVVVQPDGGGPEVTIKPAWIHEVTN